MPLLHLVHKSQQMISLVNFNIQLFQQRNTIINEQSQKDINSLFDLIYDIKVNHARK